MRVDQKGNDPMGKPDPTYPDPVRALKVQCHGCGLMVAGHVRGSKDFRYLMKEIKSHEEADHPPYKRDLIDQLVVVVEDIDDFLCIQGYVGRYVVSLF
jgi:hypothetical protein